MTSGIVHYDDIAYLLDRAIESASRGDGERMAADTRIVLRELAAVPYPAMFAEARAAGVDALASAAAGDFPRAVDALVLLRHVVEDAADTEFAVLFAGE